MAEIDIGLRTVSQLMPEALAEPFVASHTRVERGTLPAALAQETQLSRRELRLDKVLAVQIDGEPCLLHVEFQTEFDAHQGLRVLEYATALAMTTLLKDGVRPPIKSVVVLLAGPQSLEAGVVHEPLGWPVQTDQEDQGLRASYHLEPVYRYQLATLMARPVLWWVFAPLARDVDVASFDVLLHALRERVDNDQVRAELGVTMRVLAERNERVPGLGERVAAILGEEVLMQSEFLRSIREKEHDQGLRQGRREELLKFAAHLVDEARLEELRVLEDIDALEREVMTLFKQRTGTADGA